MAFLFYFAGMNHICFNGKIVDANQPVLLASNRGYRYGDGLFETIKVVQGKLQLGSLHFERLFSGISLLELETPSLFSQQKLEREILHLCEQNKCSALARVRLSVFRGNGGLYDNDKTAQYLIECRTLNESVNRLNENGLVIDIFHNARKSCDIFSNIKSANFLPYSLAANYAKKNKLNDSIVLNTAGNIADASVANVFIVKDGVVVTPGLEQGCINGVMRRHIISSMKKAKELIVERAVSVEELIGADEIFLSNAVNGIRWVRQCGNSMYGNIKSIGIYTRFIQPLILLEK